VSPGCQRRRSVNSLRVVPSQYLVLCSWKSMIFSPGNQLARQVQLHRLSSELIFALSKENRCYEMKKSRYEAD